MIEFSEISAVLGRNKLRTFLTAFGVFWGILMLILLLGTGNGLENGVDARFSGKATNTFFIWTQPTSKPYGGFSPGRYFDFQNEDIPWLKQNLKGIKILAPRNQLGGHRGSNLVYRKDKSSAFSVNGDIPEIKEILPLKMSKGRFLNQFDMDEKRKVAAIGQRVYETLFEKGEDPIGQTINVGGIWFTVVGVFGSTSSGDDAERYLETIHVPFSTFQKVFNIGNSVDWLSVTVKDKVDAAGVEEEALKLLARRHEIAPDDPFAFGHFNMQKIFTKVKNLLIGINALVWVVGLGTLAAGVIGVSNIMLIVVKERTKELGIRRALGAPPSSVVMQILAESIFLTGLSGYTGLISGIFILESVSAGLGNSAATLYQNPGVDLYVCVGALIILIISGALAGIIPAQRALSNKPVEALRDY